MKTTIEEILNSALKGKTITIYINQYLNSTGKFYTFNKGKLTIETHKRVIIEVDVSPISCCDGDEIVFYLNEPLLNSKIVNSNHLYEPFEIEDTPIPINGTKDEDPWKAGPYDGL